MGKKDARVDIYIAKAQPFAQPVLSHIRTIVHKACPDVEEKIKWGFPHFDYKGMMCSMASFKQHCAFTFWKASLMKDKYKLFSNVQEKAMGQLGKIASIKDLPPDKIFIFYIKEAMKLNEDGKSLPAKVKKAINEVDIPKYFTAALNKNKKAKQTFDHFSNSHKREYIEWIVEAKTVTTRNKRIQTAIDWLSDGKPRNWKYMKK